MSGHVRGVPRIQACWPLSCALAAVSCAAPLAAQPWTSAATLAPPLPSARGAFGAAVAVHGLRAVVGEPGAHRGIGPGAAHVLERRDRVWVHSAKLIGGSTAPGARFGESVSVFFDRVAVGAPLDTAGGHAAAGAVSEFRRGVETRLLALAPAAGDRFGAAVSLSSTNKMIVGAPGDDQRAPDAGSALVRRWYPIGGWRDEGLLIAPDGAAGDAFGSAVAVDTRFCVVGAPLADRAGHADAGAAYFYTFNSISWSFQAAVHALEPSAGALFGASVALDDDVVVIGAPLDDAPMASDAGSAFVFAPGGSPGVRLVAPDAAAGDRFGTAVAVSGGRILVGAPGRDSQGRADAGAVYVFVLDGAGWTHEATLEAPDPVAGDAMGQAVALSIGKACVGAPGRGPPGMESAGAVEFFHGPAPCRVDCDTSTGPHVLDVFDFLCFSNAFAANLPYACDYDTSGGVSACDVFDFLAFHNEFDAGCP